MGLTQTENIIISALQHGVDRSIPAAIISNASRKNQKTIVTTLDNLSTAAEQVEKPAVLVFGNVVKFSKILTQSAGKFNFENLKKCWRQKQQVDQLSGSA